MKRTITNLIKPAAIASLIVASGMAANAQAPGLVSTVTGKVWIEKDGIAADGIQNGGEANLSGILVGMITTTTPTKIIAVGMTNASGNYTLNNYQGLGSYTIQFYYPNEAFLGVSPTGGSSQSHVSRLGANTTATVNVTAANQTNTINMGLRRNQEYVVSCGTYSGTTTWNQNIALQKFDYAAAGAAPALVNLWSATNSYHNDIMVQENSNTPTVLDVRIGIQTTVQKPGVTPAEELYSQAANTLISESFSGNETKHFYNLNNSAVYHQSTYELTGAAASGSGTVSIPVMVQGQTTFTGQTNFSVTLPTVASFGACLVYTLSNPVSVSLISLNAGLEDGSPKLNWSTAAEKSSSGFEIEHSLDAKSWSNIGFVASKAENGNSSESLSYDFSHVNAQNGKNFYRLKQVDLDGTTTYSKTVSVSVGGSSVVKCYPNIIDQNNSNINIDGLSGNSEIAIFNINGARVAYFSSVKMSEKVDMSAFPIGLYNIVVKDFETANMTTAKIIKR